MPLDGTSYDKVQEQLDRAVRLRDSIARVSAINLDNFDTCIYPHAYKILFNSPAPHLKPGESPFNLRTVAKAFGASSSLFHGHSGKWSSSHKAEALQRVDDLIFRLRRNMSSES